MMERDKPLEPHEAAAWLPWYLNGTLSQDEVEKVEAHLAECRPCREELEEWRQLQTATRAELASRPGPSPDLFSRIAARVESYEADRRAGTFRMPWWERVAQWLFDLLPRRLAPALILGIVVLQFAALVVMSGTLYRALRGQEYVTSAGPEAVRPAAGSFVRFKVAFEETAPEREIRTFLQEINGRILDGPSAAGFYIVAAPIGKPQDSDAVLRVLQARHGLVRFAEQVGR